MKTIHHKIVGFNINVNKFSILADFANESRQPCLLMWLNETEGVRVLLGCQYSYLCICGDLFGQLFQGPSCFLK